MSHRTKRSKSFQTNSTTDMTIQFFNGENLIKNRNAKVVPTRGDIVSFVRNEYFHVISVEYHFEDDKIVIRLQKV